jgi:small-conductance mechanosensitive channel
MSQTETAEAGPQAVVASSPEPVVDKSLASIVVKADALKEDFTALATKIAEVKDLKKSSEDLVESRARLAELKARHESTRTSGAYGFEQISQLRSDTRLLLEAIGKKSGLASAKLELAGSLKQTWKAKEASWSESKSALKGEVGESVQTIFKEAEKIIKQALKDMEGIETPLIVFQQQTLDLQREGQSLASELDKLLVEMRRDLFRKSRPAMFTPTFFRQFTSETWHEFWLGLATLELPTAEFYATYGWIFVLQFIIFAVAIYFFKTLKSRKMEQLKLDFILQRYISASMLLGILLPMPFFEDKPRLVSLVLAGIVAISAARLVAGVIERPWRRRLIYMIVTLYLLVQFFNFISLPMTLMRTFTAFVGLAGVLFCRWRARANKDDSSSVLFVTGVKIGGVTMLLVLLTQVAGYVAMSSHLLDIMIKTIFLGLIAWMIDLVIRGALELLFDNELLRKSKLIDKHHKLFIKRGHLIVDIAVVFMAVANMLYVWGLFDNSSHAATAILALGVSFQGVNLTIGLLVSAIVALYLALFASWLIQTILNEEVYPRKKVDRGVGISINRLISYAFVVVGISMAFSTLGIGMQNLTVIIGALGVGIGFGLQNIVNNFASGLILLFERSIKVGDVVQINGEWGLIKNLGLRATVVETFDRSELIVPNSDLVSATVTNWTLTDRQVRLIIPVGVAYGSDVDLVTRLLLQITEENPVVMKFPAPIVLFLNFGASSLDFELRCWVADIDKRLTIKDEINREIDRLFREHNIEIPFSQHDLHIRSIDTPARAALSEIKSVDATAPASVVSK